MTKGNPSLLKPCGLDPRHYHGQKRCLGFRTHKGPVLHLEIDGVKINAQRPDGRIIGFRRAGNPRNGDGDCKKGIVQKKMIEPTAGTLHICQGGGNVADNLRDQQGIALPFDLQVRPVVHEKFSGKLEVCCQVMNGSQGSEQFHGRRGYAFGVRIVAEQNLSARRSHHGGIPRA